MRQILKLLFFCIILSSCGASKRVQKRSNNPSIISTQNEKTPEVTAVKTLPAFNSIQQYIDFFKSEAIQEMKLYGIPASITLAQGILESGSGKGRLAKEANNHFGIKCHDWKGERIFHDDDRVQECFRKYDHPKQSYRDHSLFLVKRKRYSNLFKFKTTDYKSWAKGLKKAGYATDPKYPKKLISLIERYELYKYDIYNKKRKVRTDSYSKIYIHKVLKGETLYSISRRYNTTVDEIKFLNKLTSNDLKIGQSLKVKINEIRAQ